jgi:RimJ/RimL family protein N-acetyltransferase
LLEGEKVNLRILEKEDEPLVVSWFNQPEVFGEYNPLFQVTIEELGKLFSSPNEIKIFIIEDKKATKVGLVNYFYVLSPATRQLEIGYTLVPGERRKGYGTESLRIIVDFLFLSKDVIRIQAQTDPGNLASHKVLEKAGFNKEGILRKSMFIRGEWKDVWIYSILREEWKEPRILTK